MCAQTVGEEDDTGDQVEEQVERVVGEKEWRVRVGAVCVRRSSVRVCRASVRVLESIQCSKEQNMAVQRICH